jgi:tetratricopeptide (TPR) repeat protein
MLACLPRFESEESFMRSHHSIKYLIAYPAVLIFSAVIAVAQSGGAGGSIYGKVLLPNGAMLNERAKISLETDRGVKSTVFTDDRGAFEFKGLTPSIYEIVIEAAGDRFEVARAKVEVFPGAPALVTITLKDKKAADKSPATVVSVGELDQSIPPAARKEFQRATDSSQAGNVDDAIRHLQKAIAIYPKYLMALNDLGTYLLARGRLDEAAQQFRAAMEIDAKAFNPRLNLGIVLVQQQQFPNAAAVLKEALAINGESAAARLYDGLALKGLNDLPAAKVEFESAHQLGGPRFAVALFHLGQIYLGGGERDRARQMFQQYLQESPNGPESAECRRLMKILGVA